MDDNDNNRERENSPGSLGKILRQLAEQHEGSQFSSGSASALDSGLYPTLIGKILANKYQILEELGCGGMGQVFKAQDLILKRLVAIKLLNAASLRDENSLDRFLREAQLLSKLKHTNAVGLYEFGLEGKVPFLVMEFAEGEPLSSRISQNVAPDLNWLSKIFEQISSALEEAHAKGIIHRDLKPSNVLVEEPTVGKPKVHVVDFGMAKLVSDSSDSLGKLTNTGSICGTPQYLSPEVVLGQSIDARTDIYSLGIMAYELLTGATPFEDNHQAATIMRHVHTVPKKISDVVPERGYPKTLDNVISRALEKNPALRQQSATEFAREFTQAVGGSSLAYQTSPKADIAQVKTTNQVAALLERGIANTKSGQETAPAKINYPRAIGVGILATLTIFAFTSYLSNGNLDPSSLSRKISSISLGQGDKSNQLSSPDSSSAKLNEILARKAILFSGDITLVSGKLEVTYRGDLAFAPLTIFFDGLPYVDALGGNGVVLRTKQLDWMGAIHYNESILDAKVEVDGISQELKPGSRYTGKKLILERTTLLGKTALLSHRAEIGSCEIKDSFKIEGLDGTQQLTAFYSPLYSRSNRLINYQAFDAEGTLLAEGISNKDNSQFIDLPGQTKILRQSDPKTNTGIVSKFRFPDGLMPNVRIWDRSYDNKFYVWPMKLNGPANQSLTVESDTWFSSSGNNSKKTCSN